jgi:hypothetical protein
VRRRESMAYSAGSRLKRKVKSEVNVSVSITKTGERGDLSQVPRVTESDCLTYHPEGPWS